MPKTLTIEILDPNGQTVTNFTLPAGFNIRVGYQEEATSKHQKREYHRLPISDKELYDEYNSAHCTYAALAQKYSVSQSCIGNALGRYRNAITSKKECIQESSLSDKKIIPIHSSKAEQHDDHGFHDFVWNLLENNKKEIIADYECGINSTLIAQRLHLEAKHIKEDLKKWCIPLRDERTTARVHAEKLCAEQKDAIDLLLDRELTIAQVANELSVKESQVRYYVKKNHIAYAD